MVTKEQTTEIIANIIDNIAKDLDLELTVSDDLVIIGESTVFDSMAFLDLVNGIEEWMDETFELYVSIATDDEDFRPDGPFGNVKRLAGYVAELINRKNVDQQQPERDSL